MLQIIKDRWRGWQLRKRGIRRELKIDTWAAGDRSGVWVVTPELLSASSIVYSVGVGDNLTWELELVRRFGVTVHAFDPTPASVAWVGDQNLPPALVFHPTGLADRDGVLRFVRRRATSRINYRLMEDEPRDAATAVECPVARLTTLMRRLGHTHIDVLKMDIEGGEYAVLNELLSSGVSVKQLLVEFHHHFPGIGIEATASAVRSMQEAGYRIFHISERGLEFSFLLQA